MNIHITSKIDWLESMSNLSIGAFFLLNILYRFDIDISDDSLMNITELGVSTHRKHKKELIDAGYLHIEQVGKAAYKYTIGDIDDK